MGAYEFQGLTSLYEIKYNEEFLLFPNPAYNRINIKVNRSFEERSIMLELLDESGRVMSTYLKTINAGLLETDLPGNLSPGIYLFRIKLKSENQTFKFVKN